MKLIFLCLAMGFAVSSYGGTLRIAHDGKTEFVIVGRHDAAPPDAFAAQELALHLKLATGIDFKAASDSDRRAPHAFELGTGRAEETIGRDVVRALREEESVYAVKDGVVAFAGGGKAGLCYAVYSFLERELGVRWFNQEDEPHVPRRETLEVGEGVHRELPRLPYRMILCAGTERHPDSRDRLFWFRNRSNQIDGNYKNVCAELKGKLPVRMLDISPGCHSLFLYLPPDPAGKRAAGYHSDLTNGYFAAHPDWYSLSRDGKRVKNRQLCFANREMRAELERNILARMEAKGGEGFFDCSAQDVPDEFCHCDGCQALVRRYGSRGGPLFDFLLEFAPKAKARFPKAIVHFLVYRKEQTQSPPKGMKPWPDNLAAVFAPIDNDFSKDYLHPNNADSYADLKGWCGLVKTWTWYYPFTYGGGTAPRGGLERTATDTRLAVEAGLVGGYYEHDVGTFQGVNFADAETWMILQHYRDPGRGWKDLRKEFFDYSYGAAAEEVTLWSDYVESGLAAQASFLTWDGGNPVKPNVNTLMRFNRLFDRAERKVAGDPLVLQRVRETRFGLDCLSVVRGCPVAAEAYARATNTLVRATARRYTMPGGAGAQLAKRFAAGGLTSLSRSMFLATVSVKPLPPPLDAIDPSRVVQVYPTGGLKNYTVYEKDYDAATGYVVREPLKPGKKRPSPYPAGFYDKSSRSFILNAKIPEAEWGKDEFRFHRLGTVPMPTDACIVWFGHSWAMSLPADQCYRPGSDDKWDLWVSLKFSDDGSVACDRVVFVRNDDAKATEKGRQSK